MCQSFWTGFKTSLLYTSFHSAIWVGLLPHARSFGGQRLYRCLSARLQSSPGLLEEICRARESPHFVTVHNTWWNLKAPGEHKRTLAKFPCYSSPQHTHPAVQVGPLHGFGQNLSHFRALVWAAIEEVSWNLHTSFCFAWGNSVIPPTVLHLKMTVYFVMIQNIIRIRAASVLWV